MRASLVLVVVLFASISGAGQSWSAKLDDKVRFYQVTDVGALIVGTKKSLYAVDGMTGDILWRRKIRRSTKTISHPCRAQIWFCSALKKVNERVSKRSTSCPATQSGRAKS
jgi:outer membrane protein assembly factor BamB